MTGGGERQRGRQKRVLTKARVGGANVRDVACGAEGCGRERSIRRAGMGSRKLFLLRGGGVSVTFLVV